MSRILAIIIAIIIGILSFLGFTNMSSCVSEKFPDYEQYLTPDEEIPEDIYSEEDIFNSDILEDADPQPAEVISDDIISADDAEDANQFILPIGSLGMMIPDSYEIESDYSSDNEFYIKGKDAETGVEFEIFGFNDPENSAIELLEFNQEVLEEEIQYINGVPAIITYDEDTDTDICICADLSIDYLVVIIFNRADGENVSADVFETIAISEP